MSSAAHAALGVLPALSSTNKTERFDKGRPRSTGGWRMALPSQTIRAPKLGIGAGLSGASKCRFRPARTELRGCRAARKDTPSSATVVGIEDTPSGLLHAAAAPSEKYDGKEASQIRRQLLKLGVALSLFTTSGCPRAEANILTSLFGPQRDVLADLPPTPEVQPDAAKLIMAQLRGEEQFSSWRKPWSASAAAVEVRGSSADLRDVQWPSWLSRDWRVEATFKDAKFPMGRKFVSQTMPGFRMASILVLPNIGQEATYRARLPLTAETIGPNTKNILEAFWPAATVVSTEASPTGQLSLTYRGPTLRDKAAEQSVQLTPLAVEGWSIGSRHFLTSQVFVQDNLEQNLRGLYQVVTLFEDQAPSDPSGSSTAGGSPVASANSDASPPSSVKALQRVAAFVQNDSEPMYFDANGLAVAVYDYKLSMELP